MAIGLLPADTTKASWLPGGSPTTPSTSWQGRCLVVSLMRRIRGYSWFDTWSFGVVPDCRPSPCKERQPRAIPPSRHRRSAHSVWVMKQTSSALDLTPAERSRWKARFLEARLAGLFARHRGRAVVTRTPRLEAKVLNWTLNRKPKNGSTQWSTRKLAKELGVSRMTVARIWARAGLRPHRLRRYMASNDFRKAPRYRFRRTEVRQASRLWIVHLLVTIVFYASPSYSAEAPHSLKLRTGEKLPYWHATRIEPTSSDPVLIGFTAMPFDSSTGVVLLQSTIESTRSSGSSLNRHPRHLEPTPLATSSLFAMNPAAVLGSTGLRAFGTSLRRLPDDQLNLYDWLTHEDLTLPAGSWGTVMQYSTAAGQWTPTSYHRQPGVVDPEQPLMPSIKRSSIKPGLLGTGVALVVAGVLGFLSTSSQIEDAEDAANVIGIDPDTNSLKLQRFAWLGVMVGGFGAFAEALR